MSGSTSILVTGGATETTATASAAKLDALLAELGQKLEAGQAVGLTPTDFPAASTVAKLEQVRLLLAGTLAVAGPATDAQLRATPLPVATGGLTNAELRATNLSVSGPATNAQLRATPLPISAPTALPVDGSAVTQPVSGVVAVSNLPPTQAVTGAVTAAAPQFAAATGSLTTAASVTANVPAGAGAVTLDTGATTFVATVQFEYTLDGTLFRSLVATPTNTPNASQVTSTTTQGAWEALLPPGTTQVRLRASAFTSGTVACTLAFGAAAADPTPTVSVSGGTVAVSAAVLSAANNQIGSVVSSASATVGTGASIGKVSSAATTNATALKGSTGRVYGFDLTNADSVPVYVKLFNKATAPALGTDTPNLVIAIPATSSKTFVLPTGLQNYGTGIAYAITTSPADTDATALASAGKVIGSIFYI